MYIFLYFIGYFLVAFVFKSIHTYIKTGVNPLVLPKGHLPEAIVGNYFKYLILLIFMYLGVGLYIRHAQWFQMPLLAQITVSVFMFFSFLITLFSQFTMGASWRIGIDREHPTDLVQTGIFQWSRNPIFASMILNMVALFVLQPNAYTLSFLALSYVLISLQIAFEEQFLVQVFPESYPVYFQKTPRYF